MKNSNYFGFFLVCLLIASGAQFALSESKYVSFINEDLSLSLQVIFPPAPNWKFEKLSKAVLYAEQAGSSALVVLHKGKLVVEWGKTAFPMKSHSVRKSLLSALYGVAVSREEIMLLSTLEELGIDDRPPCLTAEEKQARIIDLLKARSGVYHDAAAETKGMKKLRPSRGAFAPGEHWYYNNWDFNVLGTIFEREVNKPIGQAFVEWIAEPIGMQDFTEDDVSYYWEEESLHPAYFFWITARDLARFGQLFLQKGRWGNEQVLSEKWVEESTTMHSQMSDNGYGYMWWIYPEGRYAASGYMGQKVLVIPEYQIVIVNRVFSGTPSFDRIPKKVFDELRGYVDHVSREEFNNIVELIIQAMPDGD